MLHFPKDYTPTLFDHVYMSTFAKRPTNLGGAWYIPDDTLRYTLHRAKRWVLTEPVSRFMADLATNGFIVKDERIARRRIESMRHSARVPHAVTWIEFSLRDYMSRMEEIRTTKPGKFKVWRLAKDGVTKFSDSDVTLALDPPYDPDAVPQKEGWLIEQNPHNENLFEAHLWSWNPEPDEMGFDMWLFPWKYTWTVDDQTKIPTQEFITKNNHVFEISRLLTGLGFYGTDKVTAMQADHCTHEVFKKDAVVDLLTEWGGVMRRIWSLLATINDIPVQTKDVTPSRGFMGRGQVRKFLPYKTLNLTVPQDEYRKLARRVLALSARRAEHPVRGHYRVDFRKPPSKLCDHTWDANEICTTCRGHRIHIKEHKRGDPKLGHVDHNYTLQHQSEQEARR